MSGKGRGRGWLKLDKVQETKPGATSPVTRETEVIKESKENFARLIAEVNNFEANDDGIVLNKKYKIICKMLKEDLRTLELVGNFSKCIVNKALQDETFITPLVIFMALNSFRDLEICEERPFRLILQSMQAIYESLDAKVLKEDKIMFHNFIKLLCQFRDKKYYVFLGRVMFDCFLILLNSEEEENIEFFANMYFKNLKHILESENEYVLQITLKIRDIMISKSDLQESIKIKLMLIIDVHNNEKRILPSALLTYYNNKLEDFGSLISQNQQQNPISIKTNSLQFDKLLKYSSDVNVLLCVDKQNKVSSEGDTFVSNRLKGAYYKTPQSTVDTQSNTNSSEENNHPRLGRPILGAGARVYVRENKDETYVSITKPKVDNSNHQSYKNKGWEHDDRFVHDYS